MSRSRLIRLTLILALLLLPVLQASFGDDAKGNEAKKQDEAAFFETTVFPILQSRCHKCHGDVAKPRGGLSLTSRETMLKGGETGPAVSLEKPEESLLLKAINYSDLEMPPTGKLPQKEIDALTRWVKAGLPWSAKAVVAAKPPKPEHKAPSLEEGRTYWAYQPIRRPEPPSVKDAAWVKTPVDAFILAKLEEKGLRPNPPADRAALGRRAWYDLIGLPPTPEELDGFVNDPAPDAFEKLVDRLLRMPQYGEKWGRHWLDLVRYAESNGYERDGVKPFAWRYRDYVIRSFNEDKPYDQFIREQLAGDELPGPYPDNIIATGYYRLGLWDDEPVDPLQARYDELDDIVATTSQVFLGITMNCARCHDHKIDPLFQKDYYQLVAFFQDIPHFSSTRDVRSAANLTDISPPEVKARYEKTMLERDAREAALKAEMTRIEDEAIKKMPAEEQRAAEGLDRPAVVKKIGPYLDDQQTARYGKLRMELAALKKLSRPEQELALSVNKCLLRPPQSHVLVRGNPHAKGEPVAPAFPAVLGGGAPQIPEPRPDARASGRRPVLADWIASKENPLTARVMANRLWQHHFGRGIVASANDFGRFGTMPTHPELLDWLASELVEGGWRLKRIHRLLMLSSTYQMSSRGNPEAIAQDPANTLIWRFAMRRLTAEEVRDTILSVSGRLNLKMGGPSVYPPIPREVLAGQSKPGDGWGQSSPEEASRRSVYVHIKRSLLVPILIQHDQADTDSSCPVRYTTTVPTQALGMLNGDFTNDQAAAFAERLRRESAGDLAAQVARGIRLTTGRRPGAAEIEKDVALIRELLHQHRLGERDALRQYCLMLLNANEMVYID